MSTKITGGGYTIEAVEYPDEPKFESWSPPPWQFIARPDVLDALLAEMGGVNEARQLPPAAGTGSKDQSPAVVSIDPERLTTGDAIPWATGYQMRDDVANERLPSDQPKPAPATCPACVAGKDDDSLPFGGHTCGLYVGHEKWISVEEARAQWEKKLAPLSDPRWDLDDGDAP